MSATKKILFGGLGALTPVIINLLVVDFSTVLSNQTMGVLVGYVVRVLVLFYLGGLVAWLHTDEVSPLKLFQLGIAAPALLTTYMNAQNTIPAKGLPERPIAGIMELLVPSAHAQEKDKPANMPKSGFLDEFWYGLTGAQKNAPVKQLPQVDDSTRKYFVVVGTRVNYDAAKVDAEAINKSKPGFKAEPYRAMNGLYGIGIGFDLTRNQALELRSKALAAGFPSDTYITWRIEPVNPEME